MNRFSRRIVETLKTDGDRKFVPSPIPSENPYKDIITIIGCRLIEVSDYEVHISHYILNRIEVLETFMTSFV